MLFRDQQKVWLIISVSDTGKGIKPEDQAKLFSEFVQVDTRKNRGIEGTGLGLAITRRLCLLMGGDITVESEYGKGTVFTAIIPQTIESETTFAAVEDPEKKKVLIYEGRLVYARSVCWTLKNLNVPYVMTTDLDVFAKALYSEEWFYVFSGYGLYDKIKPLIEKDDSAFQGGKKPSVALMVEWGVEAFNPNVRFMSLPVQSLSVANILNGNADSKGYTDIAGTIRFTFPTARLLIVDDIATNLRVAEGLLAPYRMLIDTCLNGLRAIEMVKQRKYDLILMDHMMPEMDGVEATQAIREWEKQQEPGHPQTPIIALTANAVVGMREMFIEHGFNDFLAKPIDVSKMDEMIDRWMPKEKRESGAGSRESETENTAKESPLPVIPGVDTQKGIAMTGGTAEVYRSVLALFRKDAEDRLVLLQKTPEKDALPKFVTQVHALKSASASIGAADLSTQAARLETAGRAEDMAFIRENLPSFAERLAELANGIKAWEKTIKEHDLEKPTAASDSGTAVPLLRELATALKSKKAEDIERVLEQLALQHLDTDIKTAVDQISDEVLMAEFDKATEILDKALKTLVPAS